MTKQRNSPERQAMLGSRALAQRSRTAGVSQANFRTKKLDKLKRPTRMQGVPASINRRTGKPHEHTREKARRRAAA